MSRLGQWGKTLGLAGSTALVAWACSGSTSEGPPSGNDAGAAGADAQVTAAAGQGGQSGEGGQAGQVGQAGQHQDPPVRSCFEHASCCDWGATLNEAPPTSLEDFEPPCRFTNYVERYVSSCGGILLEASNGVQTQRWSFDANGQLIGSEAVGDVGDCDFWGTRCEKIGPAEVLCQGGAGGTP